MRFIIFCLSIIFIRRVDAAKWRTLWRDDFNGALGTLPSRNDWIIDRGTSYPGGPDNWGTGEVESYTNNADNVSVDGRGFLRITPRRTGHREG